MRILPPKSIMWSIRYRQYLSRLTRSWAEAANSSQIVLFDQAFVQSVCFLAVLGRCGSVARIAEALDCVPKQDLLIRVEAPANILEKRLSERLSRQGRMERLLELDTRTNLESLRIIGQVDDLLRRQGRRVARTGSADPNSLGEAVEQIARGIIAKPNASSARRGHEERRSL